MNHYKIIIVILSVVALLGIGLPGATATIEVSQPVQVTSDSYYERGQSVVYDGTYYWLFYGRSASVTGNYQNDNPDVSDYQIYYKKATTVAGLASATPAAVPGAASCYIGEIGSAYHGGYVWTFACLPSTTYTDRRSLYGWYTTDGSSWTQVADMADNLPDGAAHHDETSFDGKLFIMANYPDGNSGWHTKWTSDPTAGTITWSSYVPLNSVSNLINGTGHFYVEGTNLYIAVLRTSPTKDNKILQYVPSPEGWTELGTASSTGWDPTLLKVGSTYMFAQAPWVGAETRQYLIAWYGSSLSTLLSGSSYMVSEARYGSNTWVEMWPIGFTDAGSTSYIFFSSERDEPAAEGTGNIWYFEVNWAPSRDHYTYIQEAIGGAAASDIVNVAAGTYEERLMISKSLDLRGAQYGVDPTAMGARTNPADESIVDITGLSVQNPNVAVEIPSGVTNVSLAGFSLTGSPTSYYADESVIRCWDDNLTIADNIFDGYMGVLYKGNDNLTVERNRMVVNKGGVFVQPNAATSVTIADNTFSLGGTPAGDESAMYLTSTNTASVTGNTATGFVNAKGIAGSNLTNVTVSGNTFTGNKDAISFWGNTTFITISDNDLSNSLRFGISIKGQDITISGNIVTNCADVGINVDRHVIDTERVTISDCDLSGNTNYGVKVNIGTVTETVDASGNWWGSNAAAAVLSEANAGAGVDYTPWLDDGTDTSVDPGFQGDFSTLHVDDDSPQVGSTGRVQEGVDLVTGSTVYLEPGTYEEQVEIDKDMTLSGGGGGGARTILSPDILTKYFTTSADNYPIVYIHDADDVTLEYLTIDGAGKGNANYRFLGIAFRNAGGTVNDVEIKDVRDTPFSGVQHGVALYTYNVDTISRNVNVYNCTFTGFQKNAMALNAGATTPLVVDVQHNDITGAGETGVTAQNGIQVWAELATGTVDSNTVTGIGYNGGGWVATSILNYYADLSTTGNVISNGHMGIYYYDGEGTISGNDLTVAKMGGSCYGILASDPADAIPSPFGEEEMLGSSRGGALGAPLAVLDVDIIGNTVTFDGADSTGTYGIEADAGYGPDDLDVTINYNTVCGFEIGIEIWKCTSSCDTGVFTSVVANYNYIGCNDYGMRSNADYIVSDGRYNWWGDATGPYHASLNSSGLGVNVSDYIDFDPWLLGPNEISVVPPYDITNCTTNLTYTFHIEQAGIPDTIRGYDVTFTIDLGVVTVASITEGPYLDAFGDGQFYWTDKGGGVYTVSCAILGGETFATGPGDLFTVEFAPIAEGTSDILLSDLKLRDPDNVPLSVAGADGEVQVDCTVPTMEAIVELENECYNTAPIFSNFGFDDDVSLDLAEYQIDADGWNTIFSGIDVPEWNDDGWALPGFGGLSEGSHTVYFRVKDMAGNWNGEGVPNLYSWDFIKDAVAPDPPTDFTAMPGHNKVHLTWTNPASDVSFVGVEIRLVGWHDYPEYGTPGLAAPGYPANETEGTLVTQTGLEAYEDDPRTPRDIYYYSAFSYDCAGNYSALGIAAFDRATSYWLGDYDSTGVVNISDLVPFSSAFGTSDGGGGWDPFCDWGPSDDWSRFGIPLPDNTIDFEDLMIFAMNYGNVTPLGMTPLVAGKTIEDLENLVRFELVRGSVADGVVVMSLVMSTDAKSLKGFSVTVTVNGELVRIERGSLFDGAGELFFGTVPGTDGEVSLCAAALGVSLPFEREGEVARLHVRQQGEPVVVQLNRIDLRDIDNRRNVTEVEDEYEVPFVPAATVLNQNYPNPFNPVTTITYDVSKAGHVTIQLFDVAGRLIRTLIDQRKDAGRFHIEWNGKDSNGATVPSGLYFYRMHTAGYTATRKMILLR